MIVVRTSASAPAANRLGRRSRTARRALRVEAPVARRDDAQRREPARWHRPPAPPRRPPPARAAASGRRPTPAASRPAPRAAPRASRRSAPATRSSTCRRHARVTGGHGMASAATAAGSADGERPRRRSSGPPGRYATSTTMASPVHRPARSAASRRRPRRRRASVCCTSAAWARGGRQGRRGMHPRASIAAGRQPLPSARARERGPAGFRVPCEPHGTDLHAHHHDPGGRPDGPTQSPPRREHAHGLRCARSRRRASCTRSCWASPRRR